MIEIGCRLKELLGPALIGCGWGIRRWWPSSVCPSVCHVPEPKSRTEGRWKL